MSMGSVVRKMYEQNIKSDSFIEEEEDEDDNDVIHNNSSNSNDADDVEEEEEEDKPNNNSDKNIVNNHNSNANTNTNKPLNNIEINTAEFDKKGRCVRHPTVRLRKKQLFRGWKTLLSNCPECCLDEMRRVKENRARSTASVNSGSRAGGGSHVGSSSSGVGGKKKNSKKSSSSKKGDGQIDPPVAQVNVEKKKKKKHRADGSSGDISNASAGGDHSVGGGMEDDNKSIGTASTITISSYTHSSGGNHWSNFVGRGPQQQQSKKHENSSSSSLDGSVNSGGGAFARVTRMPYTDHYGENGWYTGAVDSTSGTPHGRGTMNYSNGNVYEGEWVNGVSVTPSKTREEPMPGSSSIGGSSGHRSKHHHHHRPPPRPLGRSALPTHYEDGGKVDPPAFHPPPRQNHRPPPMMAAPFPPPQQHPPPARKVVCGMPWSDVSGDNGSYTGEVNSLNIPDGMGSMRYDNGIVVEGAWNDGEIDESDESGDDDDGVMSTAMSYQGGYGQGAGVSSEAFGRMGTGSLNGLGGLGGVRGSRHKGSSASVQ